MTTGLKKTVRWPPRSHLPAGWARPNWPSRRRSPFGCTSSCPPGPTSRLTSSTRGPTPIEEESGGRIVIERYAAMALGGHPAPALRPGRRRHGRHRLDPAGQHTGSFPGHRAVRAALHDDQTPRRPRAPIGTCSTSTCATISPRRTFSAPGSTVPASIHTREPVAEMADLQGMTIRAPTPHHQCPSGRTGRDPGRPAGSRRLPENLSRGVIDGAVVPWEVTAALRVPELVGNHTEFGGDYAFYTTTFVLAMNKDAYEALPEDLRQIIDANSGQEFSAFAGRTQQEYDAPGRQMAEDKRQQHR